MEKRDDVVFRRIRGRIVPIKRSSQNSKGFQKKPRSKTSKKAEVAKGGAVFGTGVLGGLFGGSVFAEFGKESERAKSVSKRFGRQAQNIEAQAKWVRSKKNFVYSKRTGIGSYDYKFLNNQAKTFRKAASRQRLRSQKLSKTGFRIGAGSIALGGFLAASGARRVYEGFKGDKANIGEEAFTDLGTAVVVGAAAKELGAKRKVSSKAARALIKKIFSKGRL